MKKILLFLFVAFNLSSCDDGDITLESFNFDDGLIQKCPDSKELIFKTSNDELLLINLGEANYNSLFQPIETGSTPRTLTITSTQNQVIYRKYSSTVSQNTVCSIVPVSSPTVTKEWLATGGTISVLTNELTNTDDEVIGHSHNVTFLNVNFSSSDNSFSFTSYNYGNHEILD